MAIYRLELESKRKIVGLIAQDHLGRALSPKEKKKLYIWVDMAVRSRLRGVVEETCNTLGLTKE